MANARNEAEAAMIDGHECVVLSALMNGRDALPICAKDFFSPPNRTIFERVSGQANRGLIEERLLRRQKVDARLDWR